MRNDDDNRENAVASNCIVPARRRHHFHHHHHDNDNNDDSDLVPKLPRNGLAGNKVRRGTTTKIHNNESVVVIIPEIIITRIIRIIRDTIVIGLDLDPIPMPNRDDEQTTIWWMMTGRRILIRRRRRRRSMTWPWKWNTETIQSIGNIVEKALAPDPWNEGNDLPPSANHNQEECQPAWNGNVPWKGIHHNLLLPTSIAVLSAAEVESFQLLAGNMQCRRQRLE